MPLLIFIATTCSLAISFVVLQLGWQPRIRHARKLARQFQPMQVFPPSPAGSLVLAGDSLGVGVGAVDPAQSIAGRLAERFPDLRIENLAVSGARARDVAAQLARSQHREADTVLILVGANDVLSLCSPARFAADLLSAIRAAQALSSSVVLMPGTNFGFAPFFPRPLGALLTVRARMLYRVLEDVVRETQCTHVDLFQDARNNPFGEDPRRFYSEDGLHPSGEGYGIWFLELEKFLRMRSLAASTFDSLPTSIET